VSLMIHNSIRELANPDSFIGHLSPTDFVIILEPGTAGPMEERIRTRLEQSLDYFYPIRDRDQVTQNNRLAVHTSHMLAGEKRLDVVGDIKAELLARKK
jgi:hypothetical protein